MDTNNYFQRITVGATFSRTFDLYMKRWELFVQLGALCFLPLLFMMLILNGFNKKVLDSMMESNGEDPEVMMQSLMTTMMGQFKKGLGLFVADYIFYMFVGVLVQAAVSLAVAQIYANRNVTVRSCLATAFQMWCNVYCTGFIVGCGMILVAVIVGLVCFGLFSAGSGFLNFIAVLFIIFAHLLLLYVAVALMLAPSVVMIEKKSPFKAIARCWELANNNRCYIFCTMYILVFCFSFASGMLVSAVFAGNPAGQFSFGGTLLQCIPMIVVLPLGGIIQTVVYLNIRVQTEGLNQEVLSDQLESSSSYQVVSTNDSSDLKNDLSRPIAVSTV